LVGLSGSWTIHASFDDEKGRPKETACSGVVEAEWVIVTDPVACTVTLEQIRVKLEEVLGPVLIDFIAFENDLDAVGQLSATR
jgi:hypothetical protein